MRNKLLVLLLALALFALAGCGGNSAPGFSEADLVLTVSGKEYHCRDNIQSVISHLGEDYQYAEGMSCDYDGLDKTYTYPAATFYTNPLAEGDLVGEIYTESGEATTSKEIKIGARKADVTAAYGEPDEEDNYLLIYRAAESGPALCFELENDAVIAIFLTVEPV